MFLSTTDERPNQNDYPQHSAIHENDWHILAAFWHPVAFASSVGEKPAGVTLLDVPLVIYRTAAGITVAKDQCPHRGTAVSLGWVEGDQLVCPFHGFRFDGAGQCAHIPSLAKSGAKIPGTLKLNTFQVEERYGLVWVCMKETPLHPLPRWAPLDDPSAYDVVTFQGTWQTSAPRHVENFNDTSHLPWVHANTFGDRDNIEDQPYPVDQTDYGLYYERAYRQRLKDENGQVTGHLDTFTRFEFTLPFTSTFYLENDQGEMLYALFDVPSPVSAHQSELFAVGLAKRGTGEEYRQFQARVIEEDIPIVESQRPIDLPLAPGAEFHVPMDRFALEYRRALSKRFGLGQRPDCQ